MAADRSVRTWPAAELTFDAAAAGATPPDISLRDAIALALDDSPPAAIHEADERRWVLVFASLQDRADALRAIERVAGGTVRAALLDLDDENWAARTQAQLKAVRIGGIVVAPPWDAPDDALVVVIEPSTGFGTGHHASTRLCLQLLQDVPVAGRSVLDVGTGSGVLAIAAARLGAAHVTAIDNDPDALESARDNIRLNNVDVDVRQAALGAAADLSPADVVCANITGALLRRLAAPLIALVNPGGALILSGFTDDERPLVADAFAPTLELRIETHEEDWSAIALSRLP